MKKILLLLSLPLLLCCSCSSAQKTTKKKASAAKTTTALTGQWELDLIPYPQGTFEQLYPGRKPTLTFDEKAGTYVAFTGCNTARGKLDKDTLRINFKGDMMMTRMACPGEGEKVFLEYLKKVNKYSMTRDGKILSFIQGDMALMRFHRTEQH